MAHHPLINSKIYFQTLDISGDSNSGTVALKRTLLNDTAFNDATVNRIAGLKSASIQFGGMHNLGTNEQDDVVYAGMGAANRVVSVCPEVGTDGSIGYGFQSLSSDYQILGEVGTLAPFTASGETDGKFFRGSVLHPSTTARTATGTGTGQELGAVAAGQTLFGTIHVVAASGTTPTLDVVVQSDDNGSFSSPTTRLTFTQATGRTAEFASATSAVTDTHWRVSYTIAGTNPSFTFFVLLGIQA